MRDDGSGFDVARMQSDPRRGIGLRNLRERVAALGGHFDLASGPGGTWLCATLPLAPVTGKDARLMISSPRHTTTRRRACC